jgi:8-oxo-dGTP pyrophosphatase MutT (NUDIX family)
MQLNDELKALIRARLASFDVLRADPGAHRRAAVAVPLVEEGTGAQYKGIASSSGWSSAAALLLTRRPFTLRNHAGQWALPGGRIDDGETAEGAALRELREEVGLDLASDNVLGRLDDYATRSGFVITPIVVWAGRADALVPNPEEVASIHRIPMQEFMREDAPLLDPGDDPARPVMRMPVGDGWIAAPTAAILYQFRELCIAGRTTRVAHFDQPRFAWR